NDERPLFDFARQLDTVAICQTLRAVIDGNPQKWGYSGWVGEGVDLAYTHGINWLHYSTNTPMRTRLGVYATTGSLHPGGAQFALGDASVRFISDSTASTILQNLAYIADGQVIGEF